jgi:hypothetical protein
VKPKKCKICKTKFTPIRPLQPTCNEYECKLAYAVEHANKAIERKKKAEKVKWNSEKIVLKEKSKTLSDYMKETQKVFNEYIRLRDKGEPCISCGAKEYTPSCGHYFPSGKYKSVTFDEDNCSIQCWWFCNSKMSGNLIKYREGLIKKIGEERFRLLEERAKPHKKWQKHELIELTEIYKQKIKELKNTLNQQ